MRGKFSDSFGLITCDTWPFSDLSADSAYPRVRADVGALTQWFPREGRRRDALAAVDGDAQELDLCHMDLQSKHHLSE